MSLKLNNGTVLRNLEEQVLKNKEDIARHYEIDRALANLGIKIVGQVTSVVELPVAETYTGAYGDAYAVGNKAEVDAGTATYSYYVFTRPDPNAGQIYSYWLDVGKISIAGPQGPQGPAGPEGESSRWYVFENDFNPDIVGGYREGDMALLRRSGLIYRYNGTKWDSAKMSLLGPRGATGETGPRGPRGEQGLKGEVGPQGPEGPAGKFVRIVGIVGAVGQLPTPASLNDTTKAYLVGNSNPRSLYVQVGDTPATAVWLNAGPLNAGTLVSVGGQIVNQFNADTKLSLQTGATELQQVYGKATNGNQQMNNIINTPEQGTGILSTAYADEYLVKRDKSIYDGRVGEHIFYGGNRVQGGAVEDAIFRSTYTVNVGLENNVVITDSKGELHCATLQVSDTSSQNRVISKGYVDDNFVQKLNGQITGRANKKFVYTINYNNLGLPADSINLASQTPSDSAIAIYSQQGTLKTNTPIATNDCTPKSYVDTLVASKVAPWIHLTGNEDTAYAIDFSSVEEGNEYLLEMVPGKTAQSRPNLNTNYSGTSIYVTGTLVYKQSDGKYVVFGQRKYTATQFVVNTYDEGGPLDIYYRLTKLN